MLRVYCDTGGVRPELVELQRQGKVALYQFKYENRNRHIKRAAVPSAPSWKQLNYTWDEMRRTAEFEAITWDSLASRSPKYSELLRIVGPANEVDAQHLDSAYSTGCSVFLTSDKDDICSHREELQAVTDFSVLHITADWQEFLALVEGAA